MNDEGVQYWTAWMYVQNCTPFLFLHTKPRLSQQGNRIKIFQGCDLHTKFLQILYHSITTKVVAINIQALDEW